MGACAADFTTRQGQPALPDLPELSWLPANSDRVSALTREPAACLRSAEIPKIAAQIELGALAFNSPALLGGQAEKKQLSCGSCHRNGRGNAAFQFDAVSGAPGTADVTSGLFSKVRADNAFNPLPIPDLALPDGQDQVNRKDRAALAEFVRGQIEEEFSGDRPPEPVFEALLTYLQHIDAETSQCAPQTSKDIDWTQDWQSFQLANTHIWTAQTAPERAFYTRTARLRLGRLHARYARSDHTHIRARLISLSRMLNQEQPTPVLLANVEAALKNEADSTLYKATNLAKALEGQDHTPS